MKRFLLIQMGIFLLFGSQSIAQEGNQEIRWEETRQRTVLVISCDAQDVPIYVDGNFVGNSPLEKPVDVLPGWHRVSYFPDMRDQVGVTVTSNRRIRDILRMGQQDVYVEEGETAKVALSYRNIEAEVEDYDRKLRSGKIVGFSMVILFISLIGWALA